MAKTTAIVLGIIFVIAGIWGFVQAPVLGFLAADPVSSIVHIVAGIILLAVAAKPAVVGTLKTIGIIYILFAIIGFLSGTSMLGVFMVNAGANWLYLILGVIMAVVGFSSRGSSMGSMPSSGSAPQM